MKQRSRFPNEFVPLRGKQAAIFAIMSLFNFFHVIVSLRAEYPEGVNISSLSLDLCSECVVCLRVGSATRVSVNNSPRN